MARFCGGPPGREKRRCWSALFAVLYSWCSSIYLPRGASADAVEVERFIKEEPTWYPFVDPKVSYTAVHGALGMRTWKQVAFISKPSSFSNGVVKICAHSQRSTYESALQRHALVIMPRQVTKSASIFFPSRFSAATSVSSNPSRCSSEVSSLMRNVSNPFDLRKHEFIVWLQVMIGEADKSIGNRVS